MIQRENSRGPCIRNRVADDPILLVVGSGPWLFLQVADAALGAAVMPAVAKQAEIELP